MDKKNVCPICGEPTNCYMGNYRKDGLCRTHAKEFKDGKIIQCQKCGKWHKTNEPCECETPKKIYLELPTTGFDTCVACGEKTTGYAFCKNCWYKYSNEEMLDILNKKDTKPIEKNTTVKENNTQPTVENQNYENCIICGEPSNGKPQCKNCWQLSRNLADVLFQDKKYKKDSTLVDSFFNTTLKNIKRSYTKDYRITQCNYLIGIGIFNNENYVVKTHEDDLLSRAYEEIEAYNKSQETAKNSTCNTDCVIEDTEIDTDTETIDFRKQYPADIHCNDGHYVRSKDERAIDDHLFNMAKLCHAYEPKFRLTKEEQDICKKAGKDYQYFYPDFYIPEYNLYIEYFGINDQEHNQKMELKIKIMSSRKDINFRYLSYKDQNILVDKLEDILDEFKKPN